ncbi:MAG TPA: hypothetical protein PLM53_10795 [Spirochaetota bacterium]|nr:hypothetical protein [Spirochaetota bacterium]HPC39340.1 hypothetical protein [Spirochaetota bacterium]HPL15147.1 hypothetical protein [Spirochaetota bacterium]HQF08722.1 hypothetical protein [Spirochaetota bacterium]HQH97577.1 hypothetical protein [Spirochaetota bacterium]
MAKCKYKVGLLNLQDCGKEGVTVCASCNRPVCGAHSRIHERSTLCLECFVNKVPEQKDKGPGPGEDAEYRAARRRNLIYGATAFHPYYFGRSRSYGYDDYTYFDDTYAAAGDPVAGKEEIEPADFQES